MKFIQGIPRTQATLFATCLDDAIEADNEVRLIDAFVDSLKLEEFGFKVHFPENGRPDKKNIEVNAELYKRRQAIVEHPFGTIKRQWGYSYILTGKGMQRASADVGFIFIAYNLRRIINIIGFKALMAYAMTCPAFIALLCAMNQILKAFIDVWEDVSYRAGKSSSFLSSSLFLKHNQLVYGSF